jgi:segregation and condensation protein B
MRKTAEAIPDFDDIFAAVRALAAAHEPTRAQLHREGAEPAQLRMDAPRLESGRAEPVHREPRPELAPAARMDPERERHKRMLEALLFAAEAPVGVEALRARLPEGADVMALLAALQAEYAGRGVNLTRVAGKWRFETAADVAPVLKENRAEPQKLSRAALETLAIIAYHQPATRAEIEAVRGVAVSKGTLDALLEIGWVRPRGRRRAPGRPVVYVTTEAFLEHFGLEGIGDLPGKEDLKAAGLLDETAPEDFQVPDPALAGLGDELLPLDAEDEDAPKEGFHTDFLEGDDAGRPSERPERAND